MKIAYCISAFSDPTQLARLIRALDGEDCEFFVHIDRKVDVRPFAEACAAANVHFLGPQERVNVYWGTCSQVEFQMRMLRKALDYSPHISHLFMLSGQDYPLWSNRRIRQTLEAQPTQEWLAGICLESDEVAERDKQMYRRQRPQTDFAWLSPQWNDRLSKLWRRVLKLTHRQQPLHLTVEGRRWPLFKGSDYFCLTRDLAAHVVGQWAAHAEIRRYFARSFAPSETCIHTIAFNSPRFAPHCLLLRGAYPTLAALTPLHCIDYVPVIRVWRLDDMDRLLASGKMFGRKFTTAASTPLLDALQLQRDHD